MRGGKFINRVINKLNFLKKLWMMTTFILAPDSFKESMTAEQACAAMQRGIQNIIPDAVCIHVPMADGGEGTVDALLTSLAGQKVECEVTRAIAITTR